MKSLQKKSERSSLWEIFLVKEDGNWAGFRLGIETLRKLSNYLVLILCLLALSLTGWIFARWKMSELRKQLTFTKLELESSRHELQGLKKILSQDEESTGEMNLGTRFFERENSILPSLEARDHHSAVVELKDFTAQFRTSAKRVDLDFSLERLPPKEGVRKIFWIMLLHGPQGILSFPKAISSRSGELLLYHRGESLELNNTLKKVSAQFRVENFVEQSGSDPVYASLLIYDNKGSLLDRQRRSLEIKQ